MASARAITVAALSRNSKDVSQFYYERLEVAEDWALEVTGKYVTTR